MFMVPAILRRTLAEVEARTSIHRIPAHSEKAAAYMADGYARVARKPGICMAQGVGGLNLASGLRDAWLAHSPVIAFTGGTTARTAYRRRYQEVDDRPAFEAVTKLSATIDDVTRIPDLVRQAFRVATSGCPGPVHLQFSGQEGEIDEEEGEMEVLVESRFARVPAFRPGPELEAIDAALDHLASAARPVIVAGGGVRTSDASRELVALAETLQIPVATSLNGKDTILGTHPLSIGVVGTYSRRSANVIVGEADAVLFIGTQTGSITTHFWSVPPVGIPAIQIDIDPEALGRNYPLKVAIAADARVALEKLWKAAQSRPAVDRRSWVARATAEVTDWKAEFEPLLHSDAFPVRPERICKELTDLAPADAIILADTGHAGMWMGGMFDVTSPDQSFIRCAGHLGWAFPAGLGAKCASPQRPVLTFTGDSGMMYHLPEIETAVRRNINAITVVNNNSSGNQSVRGFDRAYGGVQTEKARELWTFNDLDFARIAEDMGAIGIRVDRPGDLRGAIERALEAKGPVVIDVVTDIDALAPLAVG